MGEGIVRELRMDRYPLLYLKWITNKDLLYSTWNSGQCYVTAWVGGEFGGEWIHVYVWLSPFAVQLETHIFNLLQYGFPDSSAGKESPQNAGDPSLVPGSGRSAGEGIGYPLQYSWASLVAQLVKNLPAMRET